MASSSSSSSSSSTTVVKREEFNAFHKHDRELFTRLVINLRRDVNQSLQVMSFLLYLEKAVLFTSTLIASLVNIPDYLINAVADEVVVCLCCLSYEDFATFVATNINQNMNSSSLHFVSRMTKGKLSLPVIHQNRENIIHDMTKHLTTVCYPAFEDIVLQAEMYNKEKKYLEEMEKAIEKMSHLGIHMVPNLSVQQGQTSHVQGQTSNVEQVMADDRTVFLTFSRGYPVSEAEVYSYFTRSYGDIIEAIHMPSVEGNEQAMYAKMVLRSAAMLREIVSVDESKNKFIINGKHVKARKYVHRPSH